MERAERLFKEKCWRFQIGAMERFRKEDGYVARHLVDTQYLSRLAKRAPPELSKMRLGKRCRGGGMKALGK